MLTFDETFTHPVENFELTCGGVFIGTGNFKAEVRVWIEHAHGEHQWEVLKWTNEDGVEIVEPWHNTFTSWLFEALEAHRRNDFHWRRSVETEIGYLLPSGDGYGVRDKPVSRQPESVA